MKRFVWSLDELRSLLAALALAGLDVHTLSVLATALGVNDSPSIVRVAGFADDDTQVDNLRKTVYNRS